MKKIISTMSALIIVLIMNANPLPGIGGYFSELFFENGNWVMELMCYDAPSIDSIWIKTSSGTSKIKKSVLLNAESEFLIVRNDSMQSSLFVNPESDSIQIFYAAYEGELGIESNVLYGDLPNASINSPKSGQSIAEVPGYSGLYCLDKSPTIGKYNDTIGMCGTMKGRIYDKNDCLLSGGEFYNYSTDFKFSINPDGTYSTRVYSRENRMDQLYYRLTHSGQNVRISPINFFMEPDSVVTVDIHLIDSLLVGIEEVPGNSESIMKIYPNPVNGTALNYEIDLPVKSSNCFLDVVNASGRSVSRFHVVDNSGKIELPSTMENGVYVVSLFANGKKYGSSKMVISR